MTKNQPYPEGLKIEAVKQITERGHKVAEVSARIGASQHRRHKWNKLYSPPADVNQVQSSLAEELRRPNAELKRMTEGRDIPKKATVYFAKQSG